MDPFDETKGLKPMVWTTDKFKGFNTFMDCYQHWLKKSELDSSIKLDEVFKVRQVEWYFGDGLGNAFIEKSESIGRSNPSSLYMMKHLNEVDLY
jgi:hypothetical protein